MKATLPILIAAILALGACGPGTEKATKAGKKEGGNGPNAVAQAYVKAFADLDCQAIADRSDGLIHDYYVTLIGLQVLLREIYGELVSLYPDSSEAPTLVKMRDAWKAPMVAFNNLRIDGLLRDSDSENHRRYRISWDAKDGGRDEDVLSLRFSEGQWRVDSMGANTPNVEIAGSLKTQLNVLRFSYKAGLKAVREEKPADIISAQKLLTKKRREMVEGG